MKTLNRLFWISPLALLIAGCALPVRRDPTIAQWQRQGMLPPTGSETSRVYETPESYPAVVPAIVVNSSQERVAPGDVVLAKSIRDQLQYNRGLAPSLRNVTLQVQDGQILLEGSVASTLDARVIVDDLRDIAGVTQIRNDLVINPNVY
ncbi:MAG TPA: BON domain-containing protein [Candidatus Angelobacter sp.]|nr:BON domain-containing protein [Candidatus Angelobacter sp.]